MEKTNQRTALVTGGSRGIGAAIVRRLAKDGMNVAFTYQSSQAKADALAEEVRAYGVEALAIQADSADARAVEAAVNRTARELGGLDVLVNNAGIGVFKPITDSTIDEYDLTMAVNVKAVFAASKAAVPHMGKGASIVNVGSCLVDRVTFGGSVMYSVSKAAVSGLTRALARELGPKGIRVNVVHPGPVDTDMNPADGPGADYQRSLTALGEYGRPEDIAALVAFLAGTESAFVTGAGVLADGGTNI
ncbi:SDR family NAD(P)-dependent oxidoreductase [Chitinophaga lutea]